jgi:hypothetical protein
LVLCLLLSPALSYGEYCLPDEEWEELSQWVEWTEEQLVRQTSALSVLGSRLATAQILQEQLEKNSTEQKWQLGMLEAQIQKREGEYLASEKLLVQQRTSLIVGMVLGILAAGSTCLIIGMNL